jgi:hypothetical protein
LLVSVLHPHLFHGALAGVQAAVEKHFYTALWSPWLGCQNHDDLVFIMVDLVSSFSISSTEKASQKLSIPSI